MELKDVILSTLAEIGEEPLPEPRSDSAKAQTPARAPAQESGKSPEDDGVPETPSEAPAECDAPESFVEEERLFLERMRERLLVLFEGFQSPNNKKVEAKIDLTLNFLEYLLATLDERIETLKKP